MRAKRARSRCLETSNDSGTGLLRGRITGNDRGVNDNVDNFVLFYFTNFLFGFFETYWDISLDKN